MMATGDSKLTALHVANRGIAEGGSERVVAGKDEDDDLEWVHKTTRRPKPTTNVRRRRVHPRVAKKYSLCHRDSLNAAAARDGVSGKESRRGMIAGLGGAGGPSLPRLVVIFAPMPPDDKERSSDQQQGRHTPCAATARTTSVRSSRRTWRAPADSAAPTPRRHGGEKPEGAWRGAAAGPRRGPRPETFRRR